MVLNVWNHVSKLNLEIVRQDNANLVTALVIPVVEKVLNVLRAFLDIFQLNLAIANNAITHVKHVKEILIHHVSHAQMVLNFKEKLL